MATALNPECDDEEDIDIQTESSAPDFPGHEALVRQRLQLLIESTNNSEAEPQVDGFEQQQMLLQFLVNDRDRLANQSSSARDYMRKRLPFLYSKRWRSSSRQREAAKNEIAEEANEPENGIIQKLASMNTGSNSAEVERQRSGQMFASRSNVAFQETEESIQSTKEMSTVFTKETVEAHAGRSSDISVSGRNISSFVSQTSAKRNSRHQSLQATNLMVWHRYTEIPFDITSSEFTVKTPVLPLVQGGHLVFLVNKSSQGTMHYSVKIIKKSTAAVGSGGKTKRHQSLAGQTAVINKDEFLVLKKLAHPFVASLLYFCENQLLYYYFFPQYTLANLSSNISLFMRMDAKVCVYVTCCIINAVEYLFRNCIVHRDISSKCVLFKEELKPVLFHFDYATFFGTMSNAEARLNFLPEMSSRAPEVISPEICKTCGPEHYVNCDIWGIGVLLGELLLSSLVMMRALKRKLDLHWVFSVREGVMEDINMIGRSQHAVPKDLMELLRMCLRKYPQDRPSIHSLIQNSLFAKYDVPNVHNVHCKISPLINDLNRLL